MKNVRYLLLLVGFQYLSVILYAQAPEEKWLLCTNVNCQILDSYYEPGSSFTWEGTVVEGKADGYGVAIKSVNGEFHSRYEGFYKGGKREGKGRFTHKNGTIIEGHFADNQSFGFGSITSDDGSVYEGNIINYSRHGKGRMETANGSIYEGFFVSDSFYQGVVHKYNGETIYVDKYSVVETMSSTPNKEYYPILNKPITEYFDKDWMPCEPKKASFYRRVTYKARNIPVGIIKDYYISGELQSTFYAVYLDYYDPNKTFHEGEARWFYKNGELSLHCYYYNNKKNGAETCYYENGKVAIIKNYLEGMLNGEYFHYYKTGNLYQYALYEKGNLVNDKFIELDENGKGSLVYNENFITHKSDWQFINVNGSYSKVINEGILLKSNDPKYSLKSTIYIPFNQSSDYVIEATIVDSKCKKDSQYGLIFGFKDWDNYYQFIINGKGQFYVNGKFEGVSTVLNYLTDVNNVVNKCKENSLKVFKFGEKFIFAINGITVGNASAVDLRGNHFGIIANSPGEYLLKRLSVKEYKTITNPRNEYPIKVIEKEIHPKKTESDWKASGTGFFISNNGYLVTNYHVIDGMTTFEVEYQQKGVKFVCNAELVVSDPTNDLAVLKIKDNSFKELSTIPYVFTARTEDVGTEVFTLGFPKTDKLGNEIKFNDGKISSKTGVQNDIRHYQISVPITHGNSGGPLFDVDGNLVGITDSGWENEDNINYAIKSIYLKNLIDVIPESISLPNDTLIKEKTLTEKVKLLSDFIAFIRVR